jgi:hypothetical protein
MLESWKPFRRGRAKLGFDPERTLVRITESVTLPHALLLHCTIFYLALPLPPSSLTASHNPRVLKIHMSLHFYFA